MKDSSPIEAELIAVGSELLLGGRQDTNSLFLADALLGLGLEVRYKTQVGDVVTDIVAVVRAACRRARVVLITGGLGPTADDCTREAVALALRRPLRRDREALMAVRRRLAEWRRPFRPRHRRQALVPAGATVLPNPVGSAPGFLVPSRGAILIVLPGVPAEAASMFEQSARPLLEPRLRPASRRVLITRRVLHTFGLSEAEVERRLQGLVPPRGLRLGLLASPLGVSLSLTSVGAQPVERTGRATPSLDGVAGKVCRRLGAFVYGEGPDTMEEVVGRLLSAKGLTVALAESCTGGLIGHRLTQVPGSSAYVDCSIVSYSNRAKERFLDVPAVTVRRYGAVSKAVAAAMARGARRRSGADLAVSVTGVAGPGGGTPRKPVGLVYIGVDAKDASPTPPVRRYRFHGDRHMIKLRASQAALDLLRRHLKGIRS